MRQPSIVYVTERLQPFSEELVHDDLLPSPRRSELLRFGQVDLKVSPERTELCFRLVKQEVELVNVGLAFRDAR